MMANRMLYRNESSEQGGSLDNNEWSYQIKVNDSFNNGNPDNSYHEYSGYNHDLSGYNQDGNEYNIENAEYSRDSGCYNYDTGYNGGGNGFNRESHGLYESEADAWSPHGKYNRRQSQGFQTLQDLINTDVSKGEDIPFTADDFPSLSKEPAESRLPRSEKNWAVGWAKQKATNDQNCNQVQLGTNPAQMEANPQISFQWMENELELANVANVVPMPKDVEPMHIMNQANPEGRPVPTFNQFIEQPVCEPEQFQLPLFTPPEPNFFSQSVVSWNSREIRAPIAI